MYYLLFFLYLIVCGWLLTRLPFIKNARLSTPLILTLFVLKVSAGITLGWLYKTYYGQGNDYWDLNDYGKEEYQLLIQHPLAFFSNLFESGYANENSFFASTGSFWNDLENNILIKALALFNIFSKGNYYINSLFFNFFGFLGHVALYRVFNQLYPAKENAVIAGCFLLPSTLFFSSGINKDNVIFTLVGCLAYALFFSLQKKITLSRLVAILFSFTGLLLIRNYVALVMVPGIIAWAICAKFQVNKTLAFAGTYLAFFFLAVIAFYTIPPLNPVKIIADKQQDFFSLPVANTQIPTDTLYPNIASLVHNAPQAINHGFIRPYLWESQNLFTLAQSVELAGYLLLFGVFLGYSLYHKRPFSLQPFILCMLISSLIILMLLGYIVPNTNTLVRYRSIYLPFLLTPILCSIPFPRPRNTY